MKISPTAYLVVMASFLPQSAVGQGPSCDQCAEAAPCFGDGPCAACGASAECTGVCAGCSAAGPCGFCFETDEVTEAEPVPWPIQVPQLECDYAVDKVAVNVVSGEIPEWLEGTLYHSQHTNSSHMAYDGNLANPSGILAITFQQGEIPVTSFSMPRGNNWQEECEDSGQAPPFISDCVVTVNQFGGEGTIASVCASGNLAQFVTDDAGGVAFDSALEFTWSDPNLSDTSPYGTECTGFCPSNLQPEHMAIDANGDVYSLYYTTEPAGYRIFKIPPGSTERIQIAQVQSDKSMPSYTHAGPIPTSNYIVLIEPPLPNDFSYDWEQFQNNFDPNGEVTVYVLDKNDDSGDVIAKYTADSTFWMWHVANAWEDCETGAIMLDITIDPTAGSFQSFYNSTNGNFEDSKLARLTLPNPDTAGLTATATTTILDTAGMGIEFPVTQDQYQFAGKTGHYWMAGSDLNDNPPAFPLSMNNLLKFDVDSGEATHFWKPDGLHMGEPYFVPREKDQGSMSDDGAVVAVGINGTGHVFGAVLDAADLTELAIFEIPMAPVQTFGLHNFFSTASTWVTTDSDCTASTPAACDSMEPNDDPSSAFTVFSTTVTVLAVLLAASTAAF